MTRPNAAPATPRTTASVRSWRNNRMRPAPSADRTASSACREEARASRQVRDVGTGYEQHESDGPEQYEERRSHLAEHHVVDRHRVECQRVVRFPKGGLQLRANALEIVGDLRGVHSLLRPGNHCEELASPLLCRRRAECLVVREGQVDIRLVEEMSVRREHANDFDLTAGDRDGASEHAPIAAELTLPESVGEHRDPVVSGLILPGQ